VPAPGERSPFCVEEAGHLSRSASPSTGKRYGLHRVCRIFGLARSTAYYLKARQAVPSEQRPSPKKRGPLGAGPDSDLVGHIRRVLAESPFTGEGYRKVWARLRHQGIRTAAERVRRLMREHHLQAPRKGGNAHGPKAHDGTITTEKPDEMWGTDMTTTVTTGEGLAHVFVAVDHCTCECIGLHAAKGGNRFEALEPLRQGVREHFGRFEAKAAEGLAIRHDHGSNYLSDDFQRELSFLGMASSPSFVREPEGNGCAERFIRTLKKERTTTTYRQRRCRRGYNRGSRVSVGLARPGPLLSGASRLRRRSCTMPDRPVPAPPRA
jgi:putative transposase